MRAILRAPLLWAAAALLALTLLIPSLRPLWSALFPAVARPVYGIDSFATLMLSHLAIVAASSLAATLVGVGAGLLATRPAGAEFRGMIETLAAAGQAIPPVAVLALAIPTIGFGAAPALLALALYGVLPIVENTVAGLDGVPSAATEAARGVGMSKPAILWQVELPLAAPVILAGIRTSVVINVGTAAIASTVGARTLGAPIIVCLNAANPAYVLEGALLTALLAIVLDLAFARLTAWTRRWEEA